MKIWRFLCIIVISCAISTPVLARTSTANSNKKQEQLFIAAEKALKKNQTKKFQSLSKKLKNYVLYPYLRYDYLRKNIAKAKPSEIQQFLTQYDNTPMAPALRNQWLYYLGKKNQWKNYLKFYRQSNNQLLQCYYHTSLLKTGQKKQAYQNLDKLWLNKKSLPKACNTVFRAWINDKHLSQDLAWQRTMLVASTKNTSLVNYLSRYLNKDQAATAKLWLKVARNPDLVKQTKLFPKKNPYTNAVLSYGLQRLARQDPNTAIKAWKKLKKSGYTFNYQQSQAITQLIAIRLAWKRSPDAKKWLAKVDQSFSSSVLKQWRIRNALWNQDWSQVLHSIQQLPAKEQQERVWTYWKARALDKQKNKDQAQQIYQSLTKKLDYYGVLADVRLKRKPTIKQKNIAYTAETLTAVKRLPGIQRAQELYRINRIIDARREWNYALKKMTKTQLRAAAHIAKQMNWHDRGIVVIGKLGEREDLEVTYPIGFKKDVFAAAKKYNLPPEWIFGIIRQESVFMYDVRSYVGALGLMQLMPKTANYLRKKQSKKPLSRRGILNARNNIDLGSYYLKRLADEQNQQLVLATAAYNAGPSRIKQWLPAGSSIPADIWIDNIPFKETREYVKRVMTYSLVYQWRLKQNLDFQKYILGNVQREKSRSLNGANIKVSGIYSE